MLGGQPDADIVAKHQYDGVHSSRIHLFELARVSISKSPMHDLTARAAQRDPKRLHSRSFRKTSSPLTTRQTMSKYFVDGYRRNYYTIDCFLLTLLIVKEAAVVAIELPGRVAKGKFGILREGMFTDSLLHVFGGREATTRVANQNDSRVPKGLHE
eukprot:6208654-Pleurochrysis_carterae.AAC.4